MSLPTQIQPAVGQALITKVSRLFNGTISDVLNELFQNARRAQAGRIDVDVGEYESHPALFITDDGAGIDDPASFVTLGHSGWDADIARREDPDGMGVFSLAGKRVTVRSFSKTAGRGWTVTIPEDGWEGNKPLIVGTSAIRRGTQIIIAMPDAWLSALDVQVHAAAKHFPLPIRYHGAVLPREDFLGGAYRIEEWNGCRIGIFRSRDLETVDTPRINFHGVKVPCRMPTVTEIDASYKWSVRIDIVDAPSLQLVLPARKEMVQNDELEALRTTAISAIYRTIAAESSHRLSFRDWQRAAQIGIELPEASVWLHAWRPCTAEYPHGEQGERVASGPMIILPGHDPDIEQCAAPALTEEELGFRPVSAEDGFSGYQWYDGLPRIPCLSFSIEIDGRRIGYSDKDSIPSDLQSGQATAIKLDVPVVRSAEYDEPVALLSFPLDMLVCGNGGGGLDEARIFVRDGAAVTPFALSQLMKDCCFCYDEDHDCDSWDTQHRRFERDALDMANNLLLGAEEAVLEQIRSRFQDEVQWLIPKGQSITLTASNDNLSLSLASAGQGDNP